MPIRGPYYGIKRKQFAVRLTDEQRARLEVLSAGEGLYMGEWLANLIDSMWDLRMGSNRQAAHQDDLSQETSMTHGEVT